VIPFPVEQFFFSLFMFYSISHRAICDTICLLFLSKTIPHFISPATAGFAIAFTLVQLSATREAGWHKKARSTIPTTPFFNAARRGPRSGPFSLAPRTNPSSSCKVARRAILQDLFIGDPLPSRAIFLLSIHVLFHFPPGNLRYHLFIISIEDHPPFYFTRHSGFCNCFHFSSIICHPRGGLAQKGSFDYSHNTFL
jgi:hypothetical protein